MLEWRVIRRAQILAPEPDQGAQRQRLLRYDAELAQQLAIDVGAAVEHQTILVLLELVHPEHHDDAGTERGERGIERDAEAHRDARDVATHGALRLLECGADAAHRADES